MAFWNKKKALESQVEELRSELMTVQNQLSAKEEAFMRDFIVGGWSNSGLSLSGESAMKCGAVFACVGLIAGIVSSSPIVIYRKKGGGRREDASNHPFAKMLGTEPNPSISASTFWKMMAAQKVLNGNAYAVILRAGSGRPVGLFPLLYSRVKPYQAWELALDTRLGVDKFRLYYDVTWDNGDHVLVDQDDMLHVPNIGWTGKEGLSTVKAGAQAVGLAIGAEESASKVFENGMVSQVALTYPNKMTADTQEQLRKHLERRHQGASNHHNPLIITEGGKVEILSMNPDDVQLIQSRQFSVIDIARFFRVPPVMIGETEKTSSFGAGVEQMAKWFVTFTMNDHFTDIEQELNRKLFKNSDYFAEFNETEITRGDTKTRAEYNKAAIGSSQGPAWMTANEIRISEGLEPLPDGDTLYTPAKNQPQPQQPPTGGDANA